METMGKSLAQGDEEGEHMAGAEALALGSLLCHGGSGKILGSSKV